MCGTLCSHLQEGGHVLTYTWTDAKTAGLLHGSQGVYWGIVLIHGSAPRETIHECHTHAVSQLVLMFETRPVLTMAPSLTYLIYFAVTPFHTHAHTHTLPLLSLQVTFSVRCFTTPVLTRG